MLLAFKHVVTMATLLIMSVILIIFVPVEQQKSSNSIEPGMSTYAQSESAASNVVAITNIMLIIAKGVSAIAMGVFAIFCVCIRVGDCRKKRNRLIMASTSNNRPEQFNNFCVPSGEGQPLEIV